jgi:hypothetical protein
MHRIAMYDVFVCYMHVLDVFEVIDMNIYVFAILKCRELMKNKKNKKLGVLCRAHTHGKEPPWCAQPRGFAMRFGDGARKRRWLFHAFW